MNIGCKHNVERLIFYGVQTSTTKHPLRSTGKIESSYQSGDRIVLRCPHGCPDIDIMIKQTVYHTDE